MSTTLHEITRLQARLERAEGLIAVKKSCADPGYPARERRDHVMQTVTEMAPRLGVALTCAALALPRASYYRGQPPRPEATAGAGACAATGGT